VTAILPENSGYEIVNRKDNKLGAGGVLIALRQYCAMVAHTWENLHARNDVWVGC
jgi:hypothetical protein